MFVGFPGGKAGLYKKGKIGADLVSVWDYDYFADISEAIRIEETNFFVDLPPQERELTATATAAATAATDIEAQLKDAVEMINDRK